VSELMGTLLMVGITLVAGFAIFGFVNGQAATSENQYGASVANNVNYLRESFVIVSVQFYNTGGVNGACVTSGQKWCNEFSVSVYNNGAVTLNIKQIILKNIGTTSASGASVPPLYFNSTSATTVAYSANPPTGAAKYGCSSTPTWATNIKNGTAPPSIFILSLPTCVGQTQSILVGGNYQVTLIGAYGNVVNQQITANG